MRDRFYDMHLDGMGDEDQLIDKTRTQKAAGLDDPEQVDEDQLDDDIDDCDDEDEDDEEDDSDE